MVNIQSLQSPAAGVYSSAHDEFDSWAQAIEEGVRQAVIGKADGDRWVTINGNRVLIGADGKPKAGNPKAYGGAGHSARVERARKSCVLIGTKEQAIADRTEQKLSDALGVPRTKDNSAFDLKNDDVGIEVKTLLSNSHDKITMSKTALGRKIGEAQAEGLKTFTVVADMRGRSSAQYYVKNRLGSLRIGSMVKVTLSELRDMVRNA